MTADFYRAMGYDETTGMPTSELLQSLDLSHVAADLDESKSVQSV